MAHSPGMATPAELAEVDLRLRRASLNELSSSASSSAGSLKALGAAAPSGRGGKSGRRRAGQLLGAEGEAVEVASGSKTPSSASGDVQICFDFTKGVCTRGDSCRFSHDIATIVTVNSQERGICFDFVRGQCNRGLLCRFSHDLSNLAQHQNGAGSATGAAARGQSKSSAICYDFVKGACSRGQDCRYSHDLNAIASNFRSSSAIATEICHDFSRGRCTRGTSCRYRHDVRPSAPVSLAWQGQKPPTNQQQQSLQNPAYAGPPPPPPGPGLMAPNIQQSGLAPVLNGSRYADVLGIGRHPPPPPSLRYSMQQASARQSPNSATPFAQAPALGLHNPTSAITTSALQITEDQLSSLLLQPDSHRTSFEGRSDVVIRPDGHLSSNIHRNTVSATVQIDVDSSFAMLSDRPHFQQMEQTGTSLMLPQSVAASQMSNTAFNAGRPPPPPPRAGQSRSFMWQHDVQLHEVDPSALNASDIAIAVSRAVRYDDLGRMISSGQSSVGDSLLLAPSRQPLTAVAEISGDISGRLPNSMPPGWASSHHSSNAMNQSTLGQLRQIWGQST